MSLLDQVCFQLAALFALLAPVISSPCPPGHLVLIVPQLWALTVLLLSLPASLEELVVLQIRLQV